jgi:hypothetical protein
MPRFDCKSTPGVGPAHRFLYTGKRWPISAIEVIAILGQTSLAFFIGLTTSPADMRLAAREPDLNIRTSNPKGICGALTCMLREQPSRRIFSVCLVGLRADCRALGADDGLNVALAGFGAFFSLILAVVVPCTAVTCKRDAHGNALGQFLSECAALRRREPCNHQREQHLVGVVAAHEHAHAARVAYHDCADVEQFESNRCDIGTGEPAATGRQHAQQFS